jgi:predicted unusual protein kinase regulating ubiquinone biosynthesis (AarF/ABC1/UbiB family)
MAGFAAYTNIAKRDVMHTWTHHRTGKAGIRSHAATGGTAAIPGKHLSVEQHARQVRLRLQELGPAHSCFALYLASRLDVLPAEYCREFALTPDSSQALSPVRVQEILAQELGPQLDRACAEFDFIPFQSTLISQSHYARLRTGDAVAFMLLHPFWYEVQNKSTTEILDVPEIENLCGELLSFDVITDFTQSLKRKTDLAITREAMELMARDGMASELLFATKVFHELSTGRLLTLELPHGPSLPLQYSGGTAEILARRICQVWLQQAVRGRCFPVDVQMQNIYLAKENRFFFLNCEFVGLPNNARENLAKYLGALMGNDPDTAAMYLLREMSLRDPRGKIDPELLRTHFRQAAYFGMLEPVLGTDSNALAQLIFQHWKTALDHGYIPLPHLLCFYRGLFSVAKIAKQLSPASDALHEGLEEFQTTSVFDQMRELTDWRYWYENADKFAAAMAHLPGTVDKALNHAAALPLDHVAQQASRLDKMDAGPSAGDFIVLLVLLILILQLPAAPGWTGKITPLVLMLAGVLVLMKRH